MEKRFYVKPETVISDITFSNPISIQETSGISPIGLAKDRDELEEDQLQHDAINQQMKSEYSLW